MKAFLINWYWFAVIAVIGVIAFLAGRKTIDRVDSIKYVKGDSIHDSIPYEKLVPYDSIVYKPYQVIKEIPSQPDTVWKAGEVQYITEKVDTAKIVSDFVVKRNYQNTLFDDNKGKIVVSSSVQYNKLAGLSYDFTPIEKVVTVERKRTVVPFLTGSYNTFNQASAGGGIYIKNIGVGAKYVKDLNASKTGYEGGIYIKF